MEHLFWEAAVLMFVGMGFVYAFLGLLIFVVQGIISPFAADIVTASEKAQQQSQPQATVKSGISPGVVAAITAAVSQYRQQNKISK